MPVGALRPRFRRREYSTMALSGLRKADRLSRACAPVACWLPFPVRLRKAALI